MGQTIFNAHSFEGKELAFEFDLRNMKILFSYEQSILTMKFL